MLHLFKQGFLFRRRGRCKHVLKLTSEFTFVNLATEIRKKRLSLCLKIIQKVSFLGSLLSIFRQTPLTNVTFRSLLHETFNETDLQTL